jgi:SAM-dependent methyltransferase
VTREPEAGATVERVYEHRFTDEDARRKALIWREIAAHLARYVPATATVLDLACDRGDFIANVRAASKWATDLRDVSAYLPDDVTFVQADGLALAERLPQAHFDVVFTSNYLEHLPSGDAVVAQLEVARALLKPGGRVVVLQPNIRLIGGAYWDFIDHKVALTEKSLVEAGELAGHETEHLVRRFLPYTTKSRLPQTALLLRIYLALPPLQWLMGKQMLVVGRRGG